VQVSDSLVRSADGGLSWAVLTPPIAQFRNGNSIAFADSLLYLGASFRDNDTNRNRLFRSNDRGDTWEIISPQLPWNAPIEIIHPLEDMLRCGAGNGIHICGLGGERWTHIPLGNGDLTAITHDSINVYVGTRNSGIWKASNADLIQYAKVEPPSATAYPKSIVYPNPATDHVKIAESATVTILNMAGVRLFHSHVSAGERIDITFLPKGPYMLRVGTTSPALLAVE
jgi:hypothetical protein